MKKLFVVIFAVLMCASLFAAQFHSVPVGHEAYRVIEVAEARGIIPSQSDVKPYNLNTVRCLLNTIKSSEKISSSEVKTIDRILADFDRLYGTEESKSASEMLENGFFRTSENGNTTTIGFQASSINMAGFVKGTDDAKVLDSRNTVTAYINGDISKYLSYDLNFHGSLNRVDANAYLPNELLINCEGFYLDILGGGTRMQQLPDENTYIGIEAFPEISTSISNDLFTARIGAIKRNWGPGTNSLALASTARVFDGFEFSLKPTSWFNYSVMAGSLGYFSLQEVNGYKWPSLDMDNKEETNGLYYNNFNIHRVEVGPFANIRLGLWESCVWRKRFELAYLNPFSIYMFTQNNLGDYDNMLAGLDVSYTLPGVATFYAGLSMDEMNSVRHPFSCPRNIMALQGGAEFNVPVFNFSKLTAQATYVPAFYGAHYVSVNEAPDGADVTYHTLYVNKGQSLGYPLYPDSLEFLLAFETTLNDGWKVSATLKNQMRSAQYAAEANKGVDNALCMDYYAYDHCSEYGDKDTGFVDRHFFSNIWDNLFAANIDVEKKLDSCPVTLTAGFHSVLDVSRSFTPASFEYVNGYEYEKYKEQGKTSVEAENLATHSYNPGKIDAWGDWTKSLSFNVKIGAKIYY